MANVAGKCLLVEDEPMLADSIRIALIQLGFEQQWCASLAQARQVLWPEGKRPTTDAWQFMLIDRGLPDCDGLDLCIELRKAGYSGGILMLTAQGRPPQRVEGLDAGADDYLAKPFSWDELKARIRALSRRIPAPLAQEEAIWDLDVNNMSVRGPKGWQRLTPLEFRFVSMLIRNEGRIVSRAELLREVWGFTLLPKTRTVDQFLARMRKYFQTEGEPAQHFETVRGVGYKFSK